MSDKLLHHTMPSHPFKYYDLIAMLAIAVILITAPITQKIVPVFGYNLSAGIILFPLAYLISDVLTEVYGYARARRVTWMMFACSGLMAATFQLAIVLPYADFWKHQEAFTSILGTVPRIIAGSLIAILAGDFINCYIMSKMKIVTNGRHLWARTILSTFVGQGVDSVIFFFIAFYGILPQHELINALITGWLVKVAYEVVLTPLTYVVINALKRAEGVDHYDLDVDYTPFSLKLDA